MPGAMNAYDYGLTYDSRKKERENIAKQDDDDKGLGEQFFGTTFGKGLGTVLNNPVVKNLIQPLDLLGVPQRAIASTIQETKEIGRAHV